MQTPAATIVSQYASSASIVTLVEAMNQWIDPAINLDAFYSDIFDVSSAQGVGLDVWGRIVGVTRTLQVATGTYFGFAEASDSTDIGTFNQSAFYSGAPVTGNFALSDNAFRTLIYAKALANITDGSIPSINNILLLLFPGRGNCYVTDGLNMTMTYTFTFTLTAVEFAIVSTSGVLPRPAGVSVTVVQV